MLVEKEKETKGKRGKAGVTLYKYSFKTQPKEEAPCIKKHNVSAYTNNIQRKEPGKGDFITRTTKQHDFINSIKFKGWTEKDGSILVTLTQPLRLLAALHKPTLVHNSSQDILSNGGISGMLQLTPPAANRPLAQVSESQPLHSR